jgi:acetyl-CoA carboxylase biotin carboxylase subunit
MHYDPLISKLIVWANTREETIARLKRALYNYKITGIKTSIKFLARILECPDFVEGNYNTHFIEKNYDFLMKMKESSEEFENVAAIAAFIDYLDKVEKLQPEKPTNKLGNNWKDFGRKKNVLRL